MLKNNIFIYLLEFLIWSIMTRIISIYLDLLDIIFIMHHY